MLASLSFVILKVRASAFLLMLQDNILWSCPLTTAMTLKRKTVSMGHPIIDTLHRERKQIPLGL